MGKKTYEIDWKILKNEKNQMENKIKKKIIILGL